MPRINQKQLHPFVEEIFVKFTKAEYEIYIVGGAVRDLLTSKEVVDWDFTTNATPEQILEIFPDGFYDNIFGTVGVAHDSRVHPFEITTFRTEQGYSDRRRPDKVAWGKTLNEDLTRRDFTINAMAIGANLEIIDQFNGQKDLQEKIIRAVGDPGKRFEEDALRMMRAIRIAAQLGFSIEEKTLLAIKAHSNSIKFVAWERIRDELFKLLAAPNPYAGIVTLRETGLLNYVIPEIEEAFRIEQKSPKRHHKYDVGTHLFLSLKFCPSTDPLVRLATLLHDIGKPKTHKITPEGVVTFYNHEIVGSRIVRDIANRLRLAKQDRDKLFNLVRYHQFTVDEQQTDSAVRRFIKNVGRENVGDMLDLRTGDRLGGGAKETSWRLEEYKKRIKEVQKQPFSVKDLKVNGRDVMEVLGLPPGPKIGETLEKLFTEVEEDQKKNTKEYLLKRIKELA